MLSVYIGTVGMLGKLQSLEPLKQICLMGSWFSLRSGWDMPQRQKKKNILFLKAIAVFHFSRGCARKRTLVHTHAHTLNLVKLHISKQVPQWISALTWPKKPDRDDCISRSLTCVFLLFFFFFLGKQMFFSFFQIVRVPAISFDTLTTKDVKDQDSPVNIQHAIYSFFVVFCFMLTLNKTVWCSNPSFYKNI